MPSADRTNSSSDAGMHTKASWTTCPPARPAFDPTVNAPLRTRISCPLLQVDIAKAEHLHARAAGGGVVEIIRYGGTRTRVGVFTQYLSDIAALRYYLRVLKLNDSGCTACRSRILCITHVIRCVRVQVLFGYRPRFFFCLP